MFEEEMKAMSEYRNELFFIDIIIARFWKIIQDITSAKVWTLVFVVYGLYHGVQFDAMFYVFAAAVLGIKDFPRMIKAFKGKE